MHGGNPEGMIDDEKRGNQACAGCHADLVAAPAKHTGHLPDSQGSLCYNCHMPERVYGIMTYHRDHRIGNPQPAQEFASGKPNACINCHQDKTDDWVLAAWNMGRHEETLPFTQRHFLVPHLVLALQDNYPAIRRFSHQSLTRIAAALQAEDADFVRLQAILESFDFIADASQRQKTINRVLDWYAQVDKSHWPRPPQGAFLDQDYHLDLPPVNALRHGA